MGVGPQGEARIAVPQVLGDRLDALARIQQHRGVEVPKRVHAVRSGRLDLGRNERSLPDVGVEMATIKRRALPGMQQQERGCLLAAWQLPRQRDFQRRERRNVACKPRHRHQEFLAFLKQVARAHPDRELHLVMDDYAAHKHPKIKAWLAGSPRVRVHFTPTHASWMNLVEVWFSIIERQAIHRGTFRSVGDLNAKIRAFITGWNDRSHPFAWTKTADQILNKANRQKTSDARH
jgi:hypothetical protein